MHNFLLSIDDVLSDIIMNLLNKKATLEGGLIYAREIYYKSNSLKNFGYPWSLLLRVEEQVIYWQDKRLYLLYHLKLKGTARKNPLCPFR